MKLSLSHSAVDTLNRCHRAYHYTYFERVQRIGDRAPLRRGKHFADSLERGEFDTSRDWYMQQIDKTTDQARINELWFEMLVLEYLVRKYREIHEPTDEREVEFDNPIDGTDIRNIGRIDGLIQRTGGVVLVEDKLKQMWKRAEEWALPLNRQINRYIVEYEKAHDQPVFGVEYRVTKWPSSKPKKDETVPDAVKRITGNMKDDAVFLRFFVEPNEEGRTVYEESMREAVRMVNANLDSGEWNASGSALACSEPYPCDFLNRCKNEIGWQWEYEERTYT